MEHIVSLHTLFGGFEPKKNSGRESRIIGFVNVLNRGEMPSRCLYYKNHND